MSKFVRSYVLSGEREEEKTNNISYEELCLLCKCRYRDHTSSGYCPFHTLINKWYKEYTITIEQHAYAYFKNLINTKEI